MNIKDKRKIITRYLAGDDTSLIAKDYSVSARKITSIVRNNPVTRTAIEKKSFEVSVGREVAFIQEIKNDILQYISITVKDGLSKENKESFIETITSILNQLDKINRLNMDKPTNIEETTDKKIIIDVAKTLKELDSPAKKKAFLLEDFKMP